MTIFKKPRYFLALLLVFATLAVAVPAKSQALSVSSVPFMHFASQACPKSKLLGVFVPWYQYLNVSKDSDTGDCAIQDFNLLPGNGQNSDVPLILLAVVDDMIRIAGLVAVIFVIMGGIQYATSQGNPDATSKAQSTIINALIGLAIAIVAVVFVTYLGHALT